MKKTTLYLIPTPISNNLKMSDITLGIYIDTICSLEYLVTENAKTARAFINDLPLKNKIQEINITELNEHTDDLDIEELLEPLKQGHDMGLMSDAGVPSIADPGYRLVSLAQKRGYKVVPFVGPSSIILALMASGLNGQSFSFNGYLPKEKTLKRKRIKTLERICTTTKQTQIFMEPPYKNQSMLEDILDVCERDTRLCIAMDIMGEDEYICTKYISEWRSEKISLEKKPCLYLINK